MAKKNLEKQFAVHDAAAKKAREQGASPRDATIAGLVAQMMHVGVSKNRKG